MRSRRINSPGELSSSPHPRKDERGSPHAEFHEQEERQWWQESPDALVPGDTKGFPGFLSRPGSEHFEKLHADSKARMAKLSKMQEDALREQSEREQKQMRAPKKVSKQEMSDACNRMYGEAESRRQRAAKKKEEQEYLEELHDALRIGSRCRSTPSLVKDVESHADRMYACAMDKEKRLERQREKNAETELQYMENHSVHAKSGAPMGASAFNRLYNDGVQRGLRQKQRKAMDAETQQQEIEQASVHRHGANSVGAVAAADEASDRLYLEGQLRVQRQEAQRQMHQAKERATLHKSASAAHIEKRVNLLYKDAERRTMDRQWMKDEFEKEQMEDLLRHSVHASVRENASHEIGRIFDRVPICPSPRSAPQPPRSARTAPQSRPKAASAAHVVRPATAREAPATARRSQPGDLDPEPLRVKQPAARAASRSVTPRPRNARLVGGAGPEDDTKRRGSGKSGFAPAAFTKVAAAPQQNSARVNSTRGAPACASKARGQASHRPAGPFIMTHLVEEGARQALSADLPSP